MLNQIKDGFLRVYFDAFLFFGGRCTDQVRFSVTDADDMRIGEISLNNDDTFDLNSFRDDMTLYTSSGWLLRSNRYFNQVANDIVLSALERDDLDYMAMMGTKDGKPVLPGDFEDISRADIITGAWKPQSNDEPQAGDSDEER